MALKKYFSNIFKRDKLFSFDVSTIVQQMFNEAGITPEYSDKNMFLTVIDGVHCGFKTVLKCDEENSNKLFIYAPFPISVPEHIASLIPYELNRLNKINKYKSEIAIQENNGGYSIFAFTDCEFNKAPTTNEVKELMLHTIDLMDDENFCSLACTIFGYSTYDELQKRMICNAKIKGAQVDIQMTDGYCVLRDKTDGMTASRYAGRMLMFSAHIIEQQISQEYIRKILESQTPLLTIMQEAYNVADNIERDILRKLLYLTLYKKTDPDNEDDSMLGRLEAVSMIEKDKYSLLYGIEERV